MKGHVILLTGASRGIGKALLEQLVADNQIIAVARDESALQALQERYPEIHILVADLGIPEQLRGVVRHIQSEWPDLSMLINNAGIQWPIDFNKDVEADLIRNELDVNLYAPIELIRSLLPILRQQPQSFIVNITSALALAPKQSTPIYCATKAALRHFTLALRTQLQGTNIKVIEVLPPLTKTALNHQLSHKGAVSAQWVADKVMKGLKKGQEEIAVGQAQTALWLHKLVPGLLSKLMIGR